MAIGSDPEYGVKFEQWGNMNHASQQAWFTHIRTNWKHNLMAGYAVTDYPKAEKIEQYHKEWEHTYG